MPRRGCGGRNGHVSHAFGIVNRTLCGIHGGGCRPADYLWLPTHLCAEDDRHLAVMGSDCKKFGPVSLSVVTERAVIRGGCGAGAG